MTVRVRVRVKTRKVRDLLTGPKLEALLLSKAEAVRDQVVARGIRVEHVPGDIPLPVRAEVERGPGRSRAQVILAHPSGLAVENKHGVLVESLDAARDPS